MAECGVCLREMTEADGCLDTRTIIDIVTDENYDPIAYGDEERFVGVPGGYDPTGTCHDCGVRVGEVHHPGCDWEECPICDRQLLSCECTITGGRENTGEVAG